MEKIILEEIKIYTHIGITDKERAKRQKVLVTIEIEPEASFSSLDDDISKTINYSSIHADVKGYVENHVFHLIETVAESLAGIIQQKYPIRSVAVTVKKFPYKDTKWVACRICL
jgi:dihydroneopterin aldolase